MVECSLKEKVFWLLAISAIPFVLYLLRPNLIGIDSYFFLMEFQAVGGSTLLAKFVLFGLLFASVCGIAALGSLFGKGGWKAGVFCFLSPLLVLEFAKFENDQFAFPLLFWATFFLFKGIKSESIPKTILFEGIAVGMVLFAATIWGGSLYYLFAFAFSSIIALMVAIPVLLTFFSELAQHASPFYPIGFENRPVIGFAFLWVLALGYAGANRLILPALGFFTVLLLLNAKFFLHAVPLLAVGFVLLLQSKKMQPYAAFLFQLSFILAFAAGVALLFQPPSFEQLDAIDYTISLAQGNQIQNDWELGYWVQWRGGRTENKAGGNHFTDFKNQGLVLTKQQDLPCNPVKEFGYLTLFDCG